MNSGLNSNLSAEEKGAKDGEQMPGQTILIGSGQYQQVGDAEERDQHQEGLGCFMVLPCLQIIGGTQLPD